jgi:DNA-directed RNA polymerase subunit beta
MEIQHTAKRASHAVAIPNLVELQLNSYRWFLEEGLHELFQSFSPIYDFTGNTGIELVDFTLGEPKYTLEQCRSRDVTFEVPIKARVRLIGGQEVIESEVYLGDLPLMTEKGTFVVNGAERVVVSQLSRSAGIYFRDQLDLTLTWQFFATLIPTEGPWVDIETDATDAITVRIGQNKKFAITTLMRALHNFPDAMPQGRFTVAFNELVGKTLAAPLIDTVTGEVLVEAGTPVDRGVFRAAVRALGGEEAVRTMTAEVSLPAVSCETDAEILERFGKRVTLAAPDAEALAGKYATADISDAAGKLLVPAYGRITPDLAKRVAGAGLSEIEVVEVHKYIAATLEMEDPKVVDRNTAMVDIYHKIRPGDPATIDSARALMQSMFFDTRRYDLAKVGRHKLNKKLGLSLPNSVRTITAQDLMAVVEYIIGLQNVNTNPQATDEDKRRFTTDDIDHLENKRVRSVGELLYSQLRMGFLRMEKVAKERMTSLDAENIIPQVVLSVKPIRRGDQELLRLVAAVAVHGPDQPAGGADAQAAPVALGPGGLSRQSAKLEVPRRPPLALRRICPIETPEGPNIGLIGSMAVHARATRSASWSPRTGVVGGNSAPDEIDGLPPTNEPTSGIAAAARRLNGRRTFEGRDASRCGYTTSTRSVPTGQIDLHGTRRRSSSCRSLRP